MTRITPITRAALPRKLPRPKASLSQKRTADGEVALKSQVSHTHVLREQAPRNHSTQFVAQYVGQQLKNNPAHTDQSRAALNEVILRQRAKAENAYRESLDLIYSQLGHISERKI